jgi:thioredoxin 1
MQTSNNQNLTFLLEQLEQPILIKFVAPHCSGCKTLKPIVTQLAEDNPDLFDLVEIDMVEEPELAIKFQIRSVPTVILLKERQEITRIVGLKPKKQYQNLIQELV